MAGTSAAGTRRVAASLAAVALMAGGLLALGPAGARAATSQLCQMQNSPAAGGIYSVQNNEWGSGASECISTDGGADLPDRRQGHHQLEHCPAWR